MPKAARLGSLLLCLVVALTGLLWAGYVRRGKADGVEVSASLLPAARWGFGAGDAAQEAVFRTTRAGTLEKPRDVRRRLGFIEVRERRWVPLALNPPPR